MSTAHARPGPGTAGHGEALETDRADAVRREGTARSSSGPMALLALQRSAGNRVASAYVQRQRAASPAPTVSPAGPVPQGDVATATPETETVEASETERAARSVALTAAVPPPDPPRTGSAAPVQRGWLGDLGSAVGSAVGGAVRAVGNVAGAVRDRVLQSVTGMARRIPGYELLCVVLGRDVVTGTAVARTSAALIGGFLGLIPGSDRIRQNLQESGAIERAGQWLDAEVPRLGLNFDTIRGLFRAAWDALSPTDLLDPAGAFRRIAGIFVPPLARLRDFALAAGKKMLEFVFEGVLSLAGGLGSRVMGIIRRASGVFDQIMANPVGFAGNLIAAVRGGLGAFLTNVATHLRNGLIGWLTGSLGGIIRIPAQFNLRGILGMAMDFLGITWDRVKGKLARLIGERAVSLLERGAGIVHAIYERGLSAITDRISEFTSGIVDTVLGGIREWVTNSVVGAAITRLISMFNPAGAVIQAIIAVYNTVQFFIERAQQLGALASAVFDSIAAIASGGVGGAIRYVEQALGRAVPVVLGFLARLIGLGDVAAPVRGVMQRVQTVIDGAIDRVVGWIAGLARRAGSALRGGGRTPPGDSAAPAARTPAEATAVKDDAIRTVRQRLTGVTDFRQVGSTVQDVLTQFRARGLRSLSATLSDDGQNVTLEAVASPPNSVVVPFATVFPAMSPALAELRQLMTGRGRHPDTGRAGYVVASVAVDGREFGRHFNQRQLTDDANNTSHHAEQVLTAAGAFDQAVAHAKTLADAGQSPEVTFMVSTSPCRGCSAHLTDQIRTARQGLTTDERSRISFRLLATRMYETGTVEGPGFERHQRLTTSSGAVRMMAEAGWDLGTLDVGVDTTASRIWTEFMTYARRWFRPQG